MGASILSSELGVASQGSCPCELSPMAFGEKE